MVNLESQLRMVSLFAIVSQVSWIQALLVCWGFILQVEVLKVWHYMLGPNPSPLSEKLAIGSSLLIVSCCVGVGSMASICPSLSYPFWCGFFLIHPMYRNHSASPGFLLEEIILCIAIDSMCSWGEGNLRTSYIWLKPAAKFWKPWSWSHFNISEQDNY